MEQLCGRQTSKRTQCRQRIIGYAWTSVSSTPPPSSCANHLTADERALLESARTAAEAAFAEASRRPPACHSWPAPVDVEPEEWEKNVCAGRPELQRSLRLLSKMMTWQAGRCAICGYPGAEVEDHCHRTGLFRGYLCRGCNTQEGVSGADPFRLYRERPPAVIVGYSYQYSGYGCSDGAEPYDWVVEALGPVPPDHTREAAEYLAAAAKLEKPRMGFGRDNPMWNIGL